MNGICQPINIKVATGIAHLDITPKISFDRNPYCVAFHFTSRSISMIVLRQENSWSGRNCT